MLTLLLLLPELPPLLRSTITAVAATATRCQCTGTAVITVAAAAAQSPSSFVICPACRLLIALSSSPAPSPAPSPALARWWAYSVKDMDIINNVMRDERQCGGRRCRLKMNMVHVTLFRVGDSNPISFARL